MRKPFDPEPEQIMAFASWLASYEIKSAVAIYMPKRGPPATRENRIADVADCLKIFAAAKAELETETSPGTSEHP